MKPGDLVIFSWPLTFPKPDSPCSWDLNWEGGRIGIVVSVSLQRPNDSMYGDELLVLHEGERWSVPSAWCRSVKEDQ